MSFKLAKQLKKSGKSTSNYHLIKQTIRDSSLSVAGTFSGFIEVLGFFAKPRPRHLRHSLLSTIALAVLCLLASSATQSVYAADYAYSIIYDDNVVSNMPTDVNDGKAVGGSFSLANNTPARSGYKFLGWCNALPTTTDGTDSCSGTTYQPSAGITIASATNFHFYAMWKEATYIQNFTKADCQSQASDSDVTVVDSRDGKDYTVRYINGACWMTQNLAIEPGTEMTADDTNIASTYTNSNPYVLPGSGYDLKDNGKSGGKCYGSGTSGAGYTNACTHVANDTDVSDVNNQYTKEQLGAWYNYAAATAGTISGTSNSAADTYSICPKGWSLPSLDASSPAGSINSVIGYEDAFSPLYGGRYTGGSHSSVTTGGCWWSATVYYGPYRYRLYYNNGWLGTGYEYRYTGFYVRCVRTS